MDMEILILKKMYKIVQSRFILFSLIFFCACEKDADVKIPVVESKLVVNSFISPQDTMIKVRVTLSQPLFNNSNSVQFSSISNATVQMNNGVNTKTLIYNSTENYYSISALQFPIVVGETYHLTVSTPDGKNVNASTSIPVVNSTLTFSSHPLNDPNQADLYSIETKWNDSPGAEDFYRIFYFSKSTYSSNDTIYQEGFSDNFSDKGNDGKLFDQNFKVYQSISTTGNLGELFLIHATKEYYLFHTKLGEAGSGGNPFAEAVQMYTNINGGFGIFAGFNQYKLQVAL